MKFNYRLTEDDCTAFLTNHYNNILTNGEVTSTENHTYFTLLVSMIMNKFGVDIANYNINIQVDKNMEYFASVEKSNKNTYNLCISKDLARSTLVKDCAASLVFVGHLLETVAQNIKDNNYGVNKEFSVVISNGCKVNKNLRYGVVEHFADESSMIDNVLAGSLAIKKVREVVKEAINSCDKDSTKDFLAQVLTASKRTSYAEFKIDSRVKDVAKELQILRAGKTVD